MVSSGEKYYRSFVGYTGDDDYKIKTITDNASENECLCKKL